MEHFNAVNQGDVKHEVHETFILSAKYFLFQQHRFATFGNNSYIKLITL